MEYYVLARPDVCWVNFLNDDNQLPYAICILDSFV